MNEKDFDFDREIIDRLGELPPPEEEIQSTNPWSKPIGFIIWGFILTTLHLNFLYLQYILPTVGVILIFLGFRNLRNENRYFKAAWVLSIVKLFLHLGDLVKTATPFNIVDYPTLPAGAAMLAFQIAMFLIFRAALKATYKKADRSAASDPLIWASLWTAAAFLIALSPLAESWLAFIPMVIFYILIARSLYRIGGELDDTGYVLTNAPVRINSRTFGWAYFLVALAAVIACCIYSNHLKLEPQVYQTPEITEARQHLLDMGFPEEALRYLSDDDASLISGAVDIEAFSQLLMFDPKEVEHQEIYEGSTQVTVAYEPGKKNIEAATVYIEMPDNAVYVLQYFEWKGGRPVWQDGIQITGESQSKDLKIVGSGLFYSKKGIDYTADFPRLSYGSMPYSDMFGTSDFMQITGALSYPFWSENQGGYVLYRYELLHDGDIYATYSLLNYAHLTGPLHIPYANTEDQILRGAFFFKDAMQQHYTNYESLALRGKNP